LAMTGILRIVPTRDRHDLIRGWTGTGNTHQFSETIRAPRSIHSLDDDAAIGSSSECDLSAWLYTQILPDPPWNGDPAVFREFGRHRVSSRPLLHPAKLPKSTLAPMVNRVLTSPYLWWFDPFPVAPSDPRPLLKVLAFQTWQ
ncbi:MAG: hypothetical protein ACREEK_34200, partial [Bradyrhizobium sp.]